MKKIFAAALFSILVLCAWNGYSQTGLSVSAPQVAYVGEGFTVRYSIGGEDRPSNFEIPSVSGGKIVSGPYSSSSSSTTIINGKMSSSHSYTYSIVVIASKAGKVSISPASVKAGSKIYTSRSVIIDVEQENTGNYKSRAGSGAGRQCNSYNPHSYGYSQQRTQVQSSPNSGKANVNIDSKALFVRAIPNKTNVVKGEEVVISYKLYTLLPVSQYSINKIPSTIGFWVEELDKQEPPTLSIEEYDGQKYQVAILRRTIVYPQRTGRLTIQGMPLSIVAHVAMHSRVQYSTGDPFFDSFLNDPFFSRMATNYQSVQKDLKTNAVTINVRELPLPQPENYVGGVGSFNLTSSVSTQKVKAFEAMYLTYTIEGSGNISLINSLKLSLPDEFQISDPEITDHISKTRLGVSGSRTFKYLIIPSVEGDYVIAPMNISYYDIESGQYKTLTTPEYKIHVDKGEASDAYARQLDNRAKYRNMDILPCKSLNASATERHIFDRPSIYILFGVIVILTLICVRLYSYYLQSISDIVATKRRRATGVAVKRLKKARRLLKKGQYVEFEDETAVALWTYLLDRFKIKKSEFSVEKCAEKLLEQGVEAGIVESLVKIFNSCQYMRFSQDKEKYDDKTLYEDTVEVIASIEESIKQTKKVKSPMVLLLFASFLIFSPFAYSQENRDEKALSQQDLCIRAEKSFRQSEYAEAMLYYEKALKLSPNNKEIKTNINIVRARLVGDCYIMPEFLPIKVVKYVSGMFDLVTWTIICFVFLLVACVAFFMYRFVPRKKVLMFYIFIATLVLTFFCVCMGIERQNIQNYDKEAIVFESGIKMKTSCTQTSKDILTLYKGQKIIIVDQNGKWTKIMTEDRREGYINSKNYKKI